jgi:hypothetical protein
LGPSTSQGSRPAPRHMHGRIDDRPKHTLRASITGLRNAHSSDQLLPAIKLVGWKNPDPRRKRCIDMGTEYRRIVRTPRHCCQVLLCGHGRRSLRDCHWHSPKIRIQITICFWHPPGTSRQCDRCCRNRCDPHIHGLTLQQPIFIIRDLRLSYRKINPNIPQRSFGLSGLQYQYVIKNDNGRPEQE